MRLSVGSLRRGTRFRHRFPLRLLLLLRPRLLAAAEPGFPIGVGREGLGREPTAPVGAVAEGLILGAAAAAIEVSFSLLQLNGNGFVGGHDRACPSKASAGGTGDHSDRTMKISNVESGDCGADSAFP